MEQRAYCDQDYHGSGGDAQADRWCEDYHAPRLPHTDEELRAAEPTWGEVIVAWEP